MRQLLLAVLLVVMTGCGSDTKPEEQGHTGPDTKPEEQGHTGPVTSVSFSPDGTRIASGSGDKTIP